MEDKLLLPLDAYLKSGIHIGSKFRTKYMMSFVYRVRQDGLSIMNIQKIDERIKQAINIVSKYKPEDILVVCRRSKGKRPVRLFSELIGAKYFAGRYLPGSMTNISYENYMEPKLLITCDPWQDRNAILDAKKKGIPVISVADASNVYSDVDFIIPANNKSNKSLGVIFYLLARGYLVNTKQLDPNSEMKISLEDFQK